MNGGIKGRVPTTSIVSVSRKAEFRYGAGKGAVYSIKDVDSENGTAKCKLTFDDTDDSDTEELVLPLEQVTELVKAFNSVNA
jgi:glutamine amidotransferase-like uncharacterized protein